MSQHRSEIDGIRAIGAILVAVFHIYSWGVSGGVDVFFVVSGYFLGVGYIVATASGQNIKPTEQIGKFILRVTPQVSIILAVILVIGTAATSPTTWRELFQGVVASALYLKNFLLIWGGHDYLSRGESLDLTQHFWAVALIGQVQIVWVFILLVSNWAARHLSIRRFISILVIVFAISVASFIASLIFTNEDPARAYFDTSTRFWQFGIGIIVGLCNNRFELRSRNAAIGMSWLGLILILTCGPLIGLSAKFPGFASIWPSMAALLLIVACRSRDAWNAGALLSWGPLRRLGALSFGIYLWHWPIYAIVHEMRDGATQSMSSGAGILIASLVCAWGGARTATIAIGRAERTLGRRAYVASAVTLLGIATLAALGALTVRHDIRSMTNIQVGASWNGIRPGPFDVYDDNPVIYETGCHIGRRDPNMRVCETGGRDATLTLAIVGGSHAAHWYPALIAAAEEKNWNIISITKSACLFSHSSDVEGFISENADPSCTIWNKNVLDYLQQRQPDAVIMLWTRRRFESATNSHTRIVRETVPDGYRVRAEELLASGLRVIALRDTPWMPHDVPNCVFSPWSESAAACNVARAQVLDDKAIVEITRALPDNITLIDLNNNICDETTCYVVIDNTLVYRDSHHLTATFSKRVFSEVASAIEGAIGRRP